MHDYLTDKNSSAGENKVTKRPLIAIGLRESCNDLALTRKKRRQLDVVVFATCLVMGYIAMEFSHRIY